MSLKRWLPLLGAFGLMLMVVGVAAGSSTGKSKTRTVTRACFWVETKGDRVTYHDVKISRLNRSDTRFCIVGKPGAKGRATRGSAGPVGPVGPAGLQGERGFMGLQGFQGLIGLTERATLAGGSLEHGPRAEGGFTVRAWLPWQG